jgi:hypothetical protein
MSNETLEELQRFKNRRALPTWESTVRALLEQAADPAECQP